MHETEYVLHVGEAIRIGETIYTVVDIDHGEVCFRVDPVPEHEGPLAEWNSPTSQLPAK